MSLALAPACSCDPQRRQAKAEAKARVGARVGQSPLQQAADEKLNLADLQTNRALFARVVQISFQEARLRLGQPLVWRGEARLSFGLEGGASVAVSEEAEIRDDPNKDALEVLAKNDGGFAQRVIHSNGVMYRKYNQGRFLAQRDLDGLRWTHGDEAFGLTTMALDLVGHLIKLGPPRPDKVLDRVVVCHALEVSKEALEFARSGSGKGQKSMELKAWRRGLSPQDAKGEICVDDQTGVMLSMRLQVNVQRQTDAGPMAFLIIDQSTAFSALGDPAPSIQAPEEFIESLKRARRKRPATGFLDGGSLRPLQVPDAG